MSERHKIAENVNDSKATRLPIAEEFGKYRFGRDALAHTFRYLYIAEELIAFARSTGRPLTVLDVGCGDVYTLRVLVTTFRCKKSEVIEDYTGFDIDEVSLARTAETAPRTVPLKLVQGDVTTGGLEKVPGPYDVVICTEVIEHLQPEFVPGFLRDLRARGRVLWISTPNVTGGTGKIPADHVKEWDVEELTREMTKAGLKVEARIGTFCNLNKARAIAKTNAGFRRTLEFLEARMDSHLLSLTLARYLGTQAQNILYRCRPAGS
jgi:2-polyprenyl-3-methyl-5-hydroxy-6-metoxy-1,4-benzoquinol methylase